MSDLLLRVWSYQARRLCNWQVLCQIAQHSGESLDKRRYAIPQFWCDWFNLESDTNVESMRLVELYSIDMMAVLTFRVTYSFGMIKYQNLQLDMYKCQGLWLS